MSITPNGETYSLPTDCAIPPSNAISPVLTSFLGAINFPSWSIFIFTILSTSPV